jgi:DNA-binding NarL/FixJ family response regulator
MHARVLLADDHKMFAEALAKLLSQNYEVVGTASNGRELITLARELNPDVIVMDVSMPLLNGMEALRMLKRTAARSKFVVLTMHADVSLAAEAFRCGASGFVLKQAAGEELSTAIATALRGRSYLSSAFPVDLVTLLAEAVRHRTEDGPKITRRQREVLQLVAEGKTMKEIATLLSLSTRTVESYKYEIMRILGIHTNAELVQYAIRIGVITVMPLQAA